MRKLFGYFAGVWLVLSSLSVLNANTYNAYVTNYGDNSVSVIDLSTNTVVGSPIVVGSKPISIAITPDGKLAYVVNNNSANVSVIDTSTNIVVATVMVGTSPYGVAITPDGKYAYVTNQSGSSISVINISNNTVSTPITGLNGPKGIAITPDGNYAYVANVNNGTVSVIDISMNTVFGVPISVGSSPTGVAITPDGRYVYVTNNGNTSISVIDTSNDMLADTFFTGVGPSGLAITPDGSYLYEVNSASVGIFETMTNSLITGITMPTPSGVAINPDGTLAYVTNGIANSISVIDTSTYRVVQTITGSGLNGPFGIAIGGYEAPTQFSGKQKTNDGGGVSELYNHLKWQSSTAQDLAGYTLTFLKNGKLKTKTLKASASSYNDHNQKSSVAVTYTLTAFDKQGINSAPVTVTVGGD